MAWVGERAHWAEAKFSQVRKYFFRHKKVSTIILHSASLSPFDSIQTYQSHHLYQSWDHQVGTRNLRGKSFFSCSTSWWLDLDCQVQQLREGKAGQGGWWHQQEADGETETGGKGLHCAMMWAHTIINHLEWQIRPLQSVQLQQLLPVLCLGMTSFLCPSRLSLTHLLVSNR